MSVHAFETMSDTDASDRPLHTLPRLFVSDALAAGASLTLAPDQAHYLASVLRKQPGDAVLLFNGRDGEWRCEITQARKKTVTLDVAQQTRAQVKAPDLILLFAPLKRARIDYLAQKATEMGAAVLQPVMTHRTQAERVKLDRLQANAVEAAEQCNLLFVPEVREPQKLDALLDGWPEAEPGRHILFCDEALEGETKEAPGPHEALRAFPDDVRAAPWAVLIGPEGGFDPAERQRLHAMPNAWPVALGPRIMRADTAAVAALALWQAALGDWRTDWQPE